jgi:hypothetical protein
MPTYAWILLWAAVLGGVALLVLRERRSGRRGPSEVDRTKHESVRRAGLDQDGRGPNGPSQTWVG